MGDEASDEDRSDRISAVFALLTAKLEDSATIAAECQGRRTDEELINGARRVADLAGEATTIAGALSVLLPTPLGVRERD